ncbi:MAG: DUF2298 domain-containing protein [Lachnospiraceae bacterium]|jgi:uncharacterized membrane protein
MLILLLWWVTILVMGMVFTPLSAAVFKNFDDKGWIFSKTIGLLVSAFLMWMLNVCGILPFTGWASLLCAVIPAILCIGYHVISYKRERNIFKTVDLRLIAVEELAFLLLFASWFYIIGFKPEAYGTEKFMDFGFMNAMMRSEWMPFEDMWFSGEPVNYYYGGQFIAAFMVKLTHVTSGEGYNLMRSLVASLSFVLPGSLALQMIASKNPGRNKGYACGAGVLAGSLVAFSGNFHYIIYRIVIPFLEKIFGFDFGYQYWFPDSTRYIGYLPDTTDKTISEFPAYSTVLGDLHAHYVNLIFAVTVAAIIYAWADNSASRRGNLNQSVLDFFKDSILRPEIILAGFMTGIFRWTNFWDFPIYFVVCLMMLFFGNVKKYGENPRAYFGTTLLQGGFIFGVGVAVSLPFTLKFNQISTKIDIVTTGSPFYQLAVLWGFPVIIFLIYGACLIAGYVKAGKNVKCGNDIIERIDGNEDKGINDGTGENESSGSSEASDGKDKNKGKKTDVIVLFISSLDIADMAVFVFGICAAGLVLLPELIYVVDIYSGSYYRANTMFKLTYQAFILFGICVGYILIRGLMKKDNKKLRILSAVGAAVAVILCGYTVNGISNWFGNIFDVSQRKSSDASVFVSEYYPEDFDAVCWINENISGMHVMLEADEASYSDYCRISSVTGLPTVVGWFTHEWLWRGDSNIVRERSEDVKLIYSSDDESRVRELIKKYEVEYIYIGKLEREKYEVNDGLLQDLGKVVYSDDYTYIIKTEI